MNESFTAEDFARANLAAAETRAARRVVESRVTEHTLLGVQGNARQKVQKLVDHIADQDRVIRRRNDEIAELRERCASLEDDCSQLIEERECPLSLDALKTAWEAAEQADECNAGDVLVTRHSGNNFEVWVAVAAVDIGERSSILSRAPRREPWQDLADDLADRSALMDEDAIEAAAKALHAAGWRKGGEES